MENIILYILDNYNTLLFYYIAAVNILSVIFTLYDKIASKLLPEHRVRESSLIFLGLLGGATGMWGTMLVVRHKTKHKKFMITLPIFIILHCALIVWLHYFAKII